MTCLLHVHTHFWPDKPLKIALRLHDVLCLVLVRNHWAANSARPQITEYVLIYMLLVPESDLSPRVVLLKWLMSEDISSSFSAISLTYEFTKISRAHKSHE